MSLPPEIELSKVERLAGVDPMLLKNGTVVEEAMVTTASRGKPQRQEIGVLAKVIMK